MSATRKPVVRRAALGVLALSAVLSNLTFVWLALSIPLAHLDPVSVYERRFAPIKPLLPAHGIVGYISDLMPPPSIVLLLDPLHIEAVNRYSLAEYVLAPVQLLPSHDQALVVGNFHAFRLPLDELAAHGLGLVRDTGEGVALFRNASVDRGSRLEAPLQAGGVTGPTDWKAAALAFAIAAGIGIGLVWLLWPPSAVSVSLVLLRLGLGLGLGLGATSCTYFLSLVALGPGRLALLVVELAVLIAIAVAALQQARRVCGVPSRLRKKAAGGSGFRAQKFWILDFGFAIGRRGWRLNPKSKIENPKLDPPPTPNPEQTGMFQQPASQTLAGSAARTRRWLGRASAVVLAGALLGFVALAMKAPHGRWDAWGIWNLRARFLFRGGAHWRDAFSEPLAWTHPDYPLLVPASVARGWLYAGRESLAIPILIAFAFTACTIVVLVSAIRLLKSREQACLAALLLCGTPLFLELGISQYADVPLGFFILATLVATAWQAWQAEHRDGLTALAGAMAGCAAWTKNEGWLWLVCFAVAATMVTLAREGWRGWRQWVGRFGAGCLAIVVVVWLFKLGLAPPNELISQAPSVMLRRLADWTRYAQLAQALLTQLFRFGDWVISAPLLLAGYGWAAGIRIDEPKKQPLAIGLIALGLMLGGYGLVYLTSPYDLGWHLRTSLFRLLLQLWPAALFMFLLVVQEPEASEPRA